MVIFFLTTLPAGHFVFGPMIASVPGSKRYRVAIIWAVLLVLGGMASHFGSLYLFDGKSSDLRSALSMPCYFICALSIGFLSARWRDARSLSPNSASD